MRPPGFEPGLSAWQADVLTKLDYDRYDWTTDILTFIVYFLFRKNCMFSIVMTYSNPASILPLVSQHLYIMLVAYRLARFVGGRMKCKLNLSKT